MKFGHQIMDNKLLPFIAMFLTGCQPSFAETVSNTNQSSDIWMMDVAYPGTNVDSHKQTMEMRNSMANGSEKTAKTTESLIASEKNITNSAVPSAKITCVAVHNSKKNTVTYIDFLSPKSVNLRKLQPSRHITSDQSINSVEDKTGLRIQ